MSLLRSHPPLDSKSIFTRVCRERNVFKEMSIEPKTPVSQTVMKNYATALEYSHYLLANSLTKHYGTVSRYIDKMVNKVKSQMIVNFFDSEHPISIIGFLAIFKHRWNTFRIPKEVTMRGLPHYINETLENALKSRIGVLDRSSLIATTVCNVDDRSRNSCNRTKNW